MTSSYHKPVLVAETIGALQVKAGAKYIDATVGGGGHTREILRHGGVVLGLDTDREALDYVRQRVEGGLTLVQGNFRDIELIAKANGFEEVSGIVFDLGVSSHQLDTRERGFSFRFIDAPLDLRMNQAEGETAAQLINRISEDELYEIVATFGEEERARAIAHALVRARAVRPITTVRDVADIVESVGINGKERVRILARVFQALRISVNDELESLKKGLLGAQKLLKPGGRLVVISFHSLEDRIVKRLMQGSKPIIAGANERNRNPRARSAKLRVSERL